MTLEQEQQSDLLWATTVLNGQGDDCDSMEHAAWMLMCLARNGCTATIREHARVRLQPSLFTATA